MWSFPCQDQRCERLNATYDVLDKPRSEPLKQDFERPNTDKRTDRKRTNTRALKDSKAKARHNSQSNTTTVAANRPATCFEAQNKV